MQAPYLMPLNPTTHKTVYIAGPMTSIPNFNFEAFHATATWLRSLGFDVLNPAETDGGSQDKDWTFYIRHCLVMLSNADAIAVLPGWRKSKGARLEVHIGQQLGIPIVEADSLEPVTESILEEAQRLVHGDRGVVYGHPAEDYGTTCRMFSAILTHWLQSHHPDILNKPLPDIPPFIGTLMMAVVKISRAVRSPGHRDSLVDLAGYAECAQMCVEFEAEKK